MSARSAIIPTGSRPSEPMGARQRGKRGNGNQARGGERWCGS
jgi:hypothetical protein